jgi:hypothetical protein
MAKSAQVKFNEYLDESRETSYAIREMIDRSFDLNGNYAYAAGYLQSLLSEVIAELPKARRADLRNQLLRQAQKHRDELLLTKIKETV